MLVLATLWAGCSSQDFGRPAGGLSDIVDSGKAYISQDGDEAAALRRAEQLSAALSAWEEQQNLSALDYTIGPDDVLEISVFALETPGEFATVARTVTKDGFATLPLVGEIPLAGVRLPKVEALISAAYDGRFLKNPRVNVSVKEYRSSPVVITGAVATPGVYYLRRNSASVLEMLSLAGGLSSISGNKLLIVRKPQRASLDDVPSVSNESSTDVTNAASENIPADVAQEPGQNVEPLPDTPLETTTNVPPDTLDAVASADSETAQPESEMIQVDLRELLENGDIRLNVTVLGGDIITIPPRLTQYVYVLGYVQSPGAFELRTGQRMTELQAVAMAGGLSASARAENSFLIREVKGQRKVIPVNLTKIARGVRPSISMNPGDTLVVGSGFLARLGEFIKPSVSAGASLTPGP